MIRTYRELMTYSSFEDRFEYLKLGGKIGELTFGYERYLNQALYNSSLWRRFREAIIVRDNGCDLAIPGRDIFKELTIHHLNPITIEDVEFGRECVFDPDNTICTASLTHKAIHYGNKNLLVLSFKERQKGDTNLWRVF